MFRHASIGLWPLTLHQAEPRLRPGTMHGLRRTAPWPAGPALWRTRRRPFVPSGAGPTSSRLIPPAHRPTARGARHTEGGGGVPWGTSLRRRAALGRPEVRSAQPPQFWDHPPEGPPQLARTAPSVGTGCL